MINIQYSIINNNDKARLKKIVDELVRENGVKGKYEVNVYLVNENEMRVLGKKWMGDDQLHEVISWPLEESGPGPDGILRLGDIAILEGQEDRLEFLVEHGVRHLLGVHHR